MQLASTTIMDLVAYGGAGLGIAVTVWSVKTQGLDPSVALFLILTAVDFFLPLRAFGSAFHVAMNGASAGRKILTLLEQQEPLWGTKTVTDTELILDRVTFSFGKSSRRLHEWFIGTKLYKRNLESYVKGQGMTGKTKRKILLTVTLLMAFGFVMMLRKSLYVPCAALLEIWIFHILYFGFYVKTCSEEGQTECE